MHKGRKYNPNFQIFFFPCAGSCARVRVCLGVFRRNVGSFRRQLPCRCLDAAHGASYGANAGIQRVQEARIEFQETCFGVRRGRRTIAAVRATVPQGSRRLGAVARSKRCEAIAKRECGGGCEQWFLLQLPVHRGSFGPCGPQPWPAEARKHPAVAGRAPQAASESQPYFVILNEVKNLFPCEPKAADGLCRARRRKTNEVQSRIYSGQGYRFFVALLLRMTNY